MAKVSIDTPLAEITLRKYESPKGLEKRELVRKLCLSLGLLQPGDSRDVVVDVLQVMLEAKRALTSKEVEELTIANRKKYKQPMLGIAPSNIRRQLLRIRDLFLVEKVANNYRVKENSKLLALFEENIEKYYLNSIIKRVKEYLEEVDKNF
ncbi:MAG: hypothetical protein ISS25_02700 [Nanoarchaeota archaeon]|nr:hypothetical protein [DPANN group archaeon]MBL7116713.1 hypothetical protein [Nanoarchaeota archaeon]